jgi:hypothetical protein
MLCTFRFFLPFGNAGRDEYSQIFRVNGRLGVVLERRHGVCDAVGDRLPFAPRCQYLYTHTHTYKHTHAHTHVTHTHTYGVYIYGAYISYLQPEQIDEAAAVNFKGTHFGRQSERPIYVLAIRRITVLILVLPRTELHLFQRISEAA